MLFGISHLPEVRVLAARAIPERPTSKDDPSLCGMKPVGIFVCRARGEVFLTDSDLERFEKHEGTVALVVAGGRAGFFVRETDGSVQAIRSHEEFIVANFAATPARETSPAAEIPRPPKRSWIRVAVTVALLALPAAAVPYLQPLLARPPLALSVREADGQLVAAWNARAAPQRGRLEIIDGTEHAIVQLTQGQTSVTYRPQGGDVEFRLTADARSGTARWEAARYISTRPKRQPAAVTAGLEQTALEQTAGDLRRSIESAKARVEELTRKVAELTEPEGEAQ